jgi:hypothetical protein
MAEDDVRSILAFDGAMIGSDGSRRESHPRGRKSAGAWSHAREEQRSPRGGAQETALPADAWPRRRGVLGKAADVVVFSAERVADRATSPTLLPPEGVLHVLVGGRPSSPTAR